MRIAIAGAACTPQNTALISWLIDSLVKDGDSVFIRKDILASLSADDTAAPASCVPLKNGINSSDIDLCLSIGGDGTFLDSIGTVRDSGVPVLGINAGRMGYLTSASLADAREAIAKVKAGDYLIDKRSLIRVDTDEKLFGDMNFALNDFTIFKKDSASMITVHVHVNGVFLNSYWGDGLIISTPTGSTAYSLSCGGPIVSGECNVFVITPAAPHNLNVRPLIIADDSVITITAETRHKDYLVALDSRALSVEPSIKLTVRKQNYQISMIHFPEQDFPSRIRSKLHWGLDQRN